MESNVMNCYKCKYYYITWDKAFPKGCKFFRFKTHKLPSISVFESSGEHCHGFEKRTKGVIDEN